MKPYKLVRPRLHTLKPIGTHMRSQRAEMNAWKAKAQAAWDEIADKDACLAEIRAEKRELEAEVAALQLTVTRTGLQTMLDMLGLDFERAVERAEAAEREMEALRAALKWVDEVYPETLRDSGGANVHITWEEFNAMRAALGLLPRKPRPRRRRSLAADYAERGEKLQAAERERDAARAALERADRRLCEHGDPTTHPVRCAIYDALRPMRGRLNNEWQSIESAPQHTSVILSAPWPEGQPFRGEAMLDWNGVWKWADGRSVEPRNTPAHWMPLPDPPARMDADPSSIHPAQVVDKSGDETGR